MGNSSILGAERAPARAGGKDTDALGPSDTSDSGSDIQAEPGLSTRSPQDEIQGAPRTDRGGDTDSGGTGERGSALPDENVREGADLFPDHLDAIGDAELGDEDALMDEAELEESLAGLGLEDGLEDDEAGG